MISEKRKGPAFMIAASICWSFGGICIKLVPWGAMSIIGVRALLAAVVFAIYRKSAKAEITPGNILAALCLSATTILFVFANKLTTAAAAILLQFSAPIFIIIIQLLIYRQKPRPGGIIAVSVTLVGMLLFFADQLFSGRSDAGGTLGNIIAIISGLTFAGVFVCNKRPDVDTEQSLYIGFLLNTAVGLPFVFFQAAADPAAYTADPVAWGAILFMGIVQVGLAYLFFSKGIKGTSALLACLITAMEPVLNPLWVAFATGEVPGKFAVFGGIIIVATVVLYNIWVEKHPE